MDSAQNVFRLLTGGASFDKKKYSKDVKLFEKNVPETTSSVTNDTSALNFFASKKRKTEEPKKVESQPNTSPQQKKQKQDDNNNAKVSKKKKKLEKLKEQEKAPEDAFKIDDGVSLFKTSTPSLVKAQVVDPNLDEETLEKQRNLHIEQIHAFRHQNHIKVSSDSAPDPIQHFDDLAKQYNIREYLLRNIKESGYENPTPIQMQALPAMLHGKEVLAVAPTGSGKTASFVIPILAHLKEPKKVGFRAIIVSPTRELAVQIHREVEKLGHGKQWKSCVLTHLKHMANAKSFDILVTTPMRLVQLAKDDSVSLANVEWLIFDEADRLFDEHFIEQVDEIIAACTSSERKVCLFSATMPATVEELAKSVQKDSIRIIIGVKNTASSTINQQLLFVGNEEGKLFELRQMIRQGKMKPPVLIFVQSKERAQQLFHELIYDGINVDVMHADRTQAQRNASVEKFRSGDIWVLITTDLFSRGMDILGVNLVINYDFPQSTTSYIHRIGRTGRAGRVGEAITFYTEEDFVQLRSIANVMKQSGCQNIPEWVFASLTKGRKDKRKELETKPLQRDAILEKPWEKKKKNQGKKKNNNNKKSPKKIKEGKKEETTEE